MSDREIFESYFSAEKNFYKIQILTLQGYYLALHQVLTIHSLPFHLLP